MIEFEYNNKTYKLTEEEINAAYWYKDRQYREQDAIRQIEIFVYGDSPSKELSDAEKERCEKEFEDLHGISYQQIIDAHSSVADRYYDTEDCNMDENTTWQNAVEDVVLELENSAQTARE